MLEQEKVRNWYASRTAHILERYGADAPRVHYHTGIIQRPSNIALAGIPSDQNVTALKTELRRAQVHLLDRAAEEWNMYRLCGGRVLDSGCGLGGGSLYWAENFDMQVTAVSLVKEHLDLVNKYSFAAGVGQKVRTLCADVQELPSTTAKYDAVIAIDSSCYMDLPSWFSCLRRILKPGGNLYLCDGLVGPQCDEGMLEQVNNYFACKMVNVASYLKYARSVQAIDFSLEAAHFFQTTYPLIYMQATMSDTLTSKIASLNMHKLLTHMFKTHQLQYLMLRVDPWKEEVYDSRAVQ